MIWYIIGNLKGENIEVTHWFSESFKGQLFWAVNNEHLEYLEKFISAKLRQRGKESYGMMLVDKLPKFIKNKKNRDELLKLISRLKNK